MGGKTYNLEIKLDDKADYGQSGLKYNVNTKKWFLDGKNTIQDRTMRENLRVLKLLKDLSIPEPLGEILEFLDCLKENQKTSKDYMGR